MKHPYRYEQYIIDLARVTSIRRRHDGIYFTLDSGIEVKWHFSSDDWAVMVEVYEAMGDHIMHLAREN